MITYFFAFFFFTGFLPGGHVYPGGHLLLAIVRTPWEADNKKIQ
jgi:hypothetical protein